MSSYPRIVVRPPGPKARELVRRDEASISPSYVRFYPLVVESGEDCILRDVDGNEYIDFNSGLVCLNVGHKHPKVVNAIKNQCDRYLHYSNTDFYYREVVNLAEKLFEITPGGFEKKVYFGNSGAEAVEAAVKLSKWHTRKHQFIAFIGGFHGRTLGALSLTGSKLVQRRYYFPMLPGVTHVPYPYCYRCPFKLSHPDCDYWCVDFIDELVLQKYVPPEEVAGIVFEPIQGEGGYVVPPPEYFQRLKKLADKHGFLLIDDEVQSGMGRTGRWFAIEHWNVEPDILTTAKGCTGAYVPLGITATKSEIADYFEERFLAHGHTYAAHPLSLSPVPVVIEEYRKLASSGLLKRVSKYLEKKLHELWEEHVCVGDVRGLGHFWAVEIVKNRETKKPFNTRADKAALKPLMVSKLSKEMLNKGLYLLGWISHFIVAPPLIITEEQIDEGVDVLDETLKIADKETES